MVSGYQVFHLSAATDSGYSGAGGDCCRARSAEDPDSFAGGAELLAAVCADSVAGADEPGFGDEEFCQRATDASGGLVRGGDHSDAECRSAWTDGAGAITVWR